LHEFRDYTQITNYALPFWGIFHLIETFMKVVLGQFSSCDRPGHPMTQANSGNVGLGASLYADLITQRFWPFYRWIMETWFTVVTSW